MRYGAIFMYKCYAQSANNNFIYIQLLHLFIYYCFRKMVAAFPLTFLPHFPLSHQIIFQAWKVILCQSTRAEDPNISQLVSLNHRGLGEREGASSDTVKREQVNKNENLKPHGKKFPKLGNLLWCKQSCFILKKSCLTFYQFEQSAVSISNCNQNHH